MNKSGISQSSLCHSSVLHDHYLDLLGMSLPKPLAFIASIGLESMLLLLQLDDLCMPSSLVSIFPMQSWSLGLSFSSRNDEVYPCYNPQICCGVPIAEPQSKLLEIVVDLSEI